MCRNDSLSFASSCREFIGDLGGSIVDRDRKPFAFHVEDEVFPHYRKADETDVRCVCHIAKILIYPGETCSEASFATVAP
jgi:hypothetical protein